MKEGRQGKLGNTKTHARRCHVFFTKMVGLEGGR